MAEFPALPLWTDAYLADTRHLSRDEHGAYLLLLMEAWRRPRCCLPDDDALLAKLSACTPEEWVKTKPVVMAFWSLNANACEWTQKRLLAEHRYVGEKRAKNRASALSRWNKPEKPDANASFTHSERNAPTPTPIQEKERAPNGAQKKGSRLSENWKLPLDDEAWALERGFTRAEIQGEAIRFHNYWTSRAGASATKLNWSRTWQNWMLDKLDRRKADPRQRAETDQEKMLRSLKRYQ